jgi:hypothetical protein
VQTGEQVGTSSVVLIVAISAATSGLVSQTITQERPNPSASRSSWLLPRSERPLANDPNQDGGHSSHRHRSALPTSLGKHGRNTVFRKLLDQPPQLVPLGTPNS